MNGSGKVSKIDSILLTLFFPFLGPTAWRCYPDRSYARALLLVDAKVRNILGKLWEITRVPVLTFVWPFTSGYKALTSHRDIMYDQMSVLFLSFVGVFLYVIGAWRIYEWHAHSHILWGWLGVLAALFAFVTLIRAWLHCSRYVSEDEEKANAW